MEKCSRSRAAAKMAFVLFAFVAIICLLSALISERDLEALKHSLSLWTLVAVVLIINLISAACFVALFAAWQWIRRDLKPAREDGLEE